MIKCTNPKSWAHDKIGHIFEVEINEDPRYYNAIDQPGHSINSHYLLNIEDCEEVVSSPYILFDLLL